MALSSEQLIDAALRQQLVSPERLQALRLEARKKRQDLLEILCVTLRLPLSSLHRAAASVRGLSYFEFGQLQTVDEAVWAQLPQAVVRRKAVLVVRWQGQGYLVSSDPDDRAGLDALRRMVSEPLSLAYAEEPAIRMAMARVAGPYGNGLQEATAALGVDLVQMLDRIFTEAYLRRSSDIHIMQDDYGLRIRMRVDGLLQDYIAEGSTQPQVANGLISRIKVLANLDIAEQREPQDGGMSYTLGPPIDSQFNVRVATAPTRTGERITMRILGQDAKDLTLENIGMSAEDLAHFRAAIRKPFGMILLTGPTGSGKSTTLFAALREINAPSINIMTVENPIEYVIDGVSQIQTGAKISFASALRSLLRHDPDVMMVGEIRDEETADTALKAAMTGHLVFSTLHTNTAAGTITRLADIGCEPYLIGSTMNAVIAQRLVRRLCQCKQRTEVDAAAAQWMEVAEGTAVYRPVGCALCQGTGYRGRLGLFETLWFDDALAKLVMQGAGEEALEQAAGERLRPMWRDGVSKVLSGITTLDEVMKVALKRG